MTRKSALLAMSVSVGLACLAPMTHTASAEPAAIGTTIDCSAVYGKTTSCQIVACGPRYSRFLGVWAGPFKEYVRSKSSDQAAVFRPYDDRISYTPDDCLQNAGSGETFIVGRQTDSFPAYQELPAQTRHGLLITGQKQDGSAFLRTVGDEGRYDYQLVSKDAGQESAVWQLDVPADRHPCPSADDPAKSCTTEAMTFRVRDGRAAGQDTPDVRDVVVEMTVGPADHPYWQGVLAQGRHRRQPLGQPSLKRPSR